MSFRDRRFRCKNIHKPEYTPSRGIFGWIFALLPCPVVFFTMTRKAGRLSDPVRYQSSRGRPILVISETRPEIEPLPHTLVSHSKWSNTRGDDTRKVFRDNAHRSYLLLALRGRIERRVKINGNVYYARVTGINGTAHLH